MEISVVRKRLHETIEQARRRAAGRRTRADEATRAFDNFLESVAVPLFKQIANVLKADVYPFSVFTPTGSVRLMSDRSPQDFLELTLDTTAEAPRVILHVSRRHGRNVTDAEHVIGNGNPESITEDDLLTFVLKELEPFVER
jgi:hypothetical protein